MANQNYISGGESPYGDFRPNGFLAGMMYPDRLQDYRTRRDLQNTGLDTANQMALEQLGTYRADDPVRAGQRQKTLGDLAFGEEMRPTEQSITRQTRLADLERLPEELQTKFIEALTKKSGANFSKNAQELMQLQSIISPFGDITDENYDTVVGLGERAGLDLSRYWDYAEDIKPEDHGNLTGDPIMDGDAPRGQESIIAPTVDVAARKKKTKKELMAELNFIRRLNPEVFKFDNDMTKERFKAEQEMERLKPQLQNQKDVAGINAADRSTGSQKTIDKIMANAYSGLSKMEQGQTPTPDEIAAMKYMNFHNLAKTETGVQGKYGQTQAIIDSLKPENAGKRPEFSSSANLPIPNEQLGPQTQSADIQVGKEMTIGGKKYKIVRIDPDGAPVVNVDGQLRRLKAKGNQ